MLCFKKLTQVILNVKGHFTEEQMIFRDAYRKCQQ